MKRFQYSRGQTLKSNQKLVCRPSRWGNPWTVGATLWSPTDRSAPAGVISQRLAVELYRVWLDHRLTEDPGFLDDLVGYDLGCYCDAAEPCHADVILQRLDTASRLPDGTLRAQREIACYDIRNMNNNLAPGVPLGELEAIAQIFYRYQ